MKKYLIQSSLRGNQLSQYQLHELYIVEIVLSKCDAPKCDAPKAHVLWDLKTCGYENEPVNPILKRM